jgi:hypothetical protein
VTLANPQSESTYGPAVDLMSLVENNNSTTTSANVSSFVSWPSGNDQPVCLIKIFYSNDHYFKS